MSADQQTTAAPATTVVPPAPEVVPTAAPTNLKAQGDLAVSRIGASPTPAPVTPPPAKKVKGWEKVLANVAGVVGMATGGGEFLGQAPPTATKTSKTPAPPNTAQSTVTTNTNLSAAGSNPTVTANPTTLTETSTLPDGTTVALTGGPASPQTNVTGGAEGVKVGATVTNGSTSVGVSDTSTAGSKPVLSATGKSQQKAGGVTISESGTVSESGDAKGGGHTITSTGTVSAAGTLGKNGTTISVGDTAATSTDVGGTGLSSVTDNGTVTLGETVGGTTIQETAGGGATVQGGVVAGNVDESVKVSEKTKAGTQLTLVDSHTASQSTTAGTDQTIGGSAAFTIKPKNGPEVDTQGAWTYGGGTASKPNSVGLAQTAGVSGTTKGGTAIQGSGGATYSTANGYGPSGSFGITNKDQSNGLSLGGAVSGLNGTPAATGYIAVEIKHVTVKIIGGFKNGHLYPLTVAVDLGPNHTDINNALAIATGVTSLVMNPIPSAIAIGFRIAQKLFGNKLPSWLGGKKKAAAKPAAGAAPGKSPAAPTSGAAAPVVATPTPAPVAPTSATPAPASAGGGGGNAGVALLLTEQDLTDNPNLFVASDAGGWLPNHNLDPEGYAAAVSASSLDAEQQRGLLDLYAFNDAQMPAYEAIDQTVRADLEHKYLAEAADDARGTDA
jgi:hypothetical protein